MSRSWRRLAIITQAGTTARSTRSGTASVTSCWRCQCRCSRNGRGVSIGARWSGSLTSKSIGGSIATMITWPTHRRSRGRRSRTALLYEHKISTRSSSTCLTIPHLTICRCTATRSPASSSRWQRPSERAGRCSSSVATCTSCPPYIHPTWLAPPACSSVVDRVCPARHRSYSKGCPTLAMFSRRLHMTSCKAHLRYVRVP